MNSLDGCYCERTCSAKGAVYREDQAWTDGCRNCTCVVSPTPPHAPDAPLQLTGFGERCSDSPPRMGMGGARILRTGGRGPESSPVGKAADAARV